MLITAGLPFLSFILAGCPTIEITEQEPNNSIATAQELPVPAYVTASQINNDEFGTTPVTYCYGSSCASIDLSCHDYYRFTVTTFGRYTIATDFDDDTYNMGLYLIEPQSGGGYELLHYAEEHIEGFAGDLDVGDTLTLGTYYIGVTSFELATDIPYTLRLELAFAYE
jgi:hypothetical protein